ncbi:DUF4287 domain-containing protein [Demequina sp. NBRC 110056]|uniref:DUF4287 domain-containing protein n=1 Tax=Demequina sp. NBRC 110056 TaxID=1570345 RepID=UPI0013563E70|nr:DUF4287 domain-containing protein [Demequina sp. NBRC 110056]
MQDAVGGGARQWSEGIDEEVTITDPEAQKATQLANIEAATGRTVAQFAQEIQATGLAKHGQILAHLKEAHGLTHGNANALAHAIREHLEGGPASGDALLEAQYAGGKAHLRAVHDALVAQATALGEDVTVVTQKTAVSLRRAKQFAVIKAASAKRVELGLNLEYTPPGDRVRKVGGMCSHAADLGGVEDVDDAVAGWLAAAYDRAG